MAHEIDEIFIKNLALTMSVGIYPVEKANPQRVFVSLVCSVDRLPPETDLQDIAQVVSYEGIVKDIAAIADARHYNLLEDLGAEICKKISQDKRVRAIDVTLEKPDILPQTQGVGVRLVRRFPT